MLGWQHLIKRTSHDMQWALDEGCRVRQRHARGYLACRFGAVGKGPRDEGISGERRGTVKGFCEIKRTGERDAGLDPRLIGCGAGGGIARPLSLSPASSPEQERTTRKRLAISPVVSKTMDAWRDEASDDKTFDDAFPAIEIQDRTSRKKRVAISPIVDDVCAIEIPKPTRAVVVDGDNAEAELDRNFDLLVERLARLLAPPPRARASLLAAVDTDGWTSPGFGCAAPPPLVRRNGPPSWGVV